MTYKDAISEGIDSINWSILHITNHDYGKGDWVYEHRASRLRELNEAKSKLERLIETL